MYYHDARAVEDLPNPFTPMAYLPPELAYQMSVGTYVLVGSLSVLIWDIITNLHADIKMLTRYTFTPSLLIYYISRIASLGYLLGLSILETAPVGHCDFKLEIFFPIIMSSTSLLFFYRIRALYIGNNYVVGLFFALWLCVVASSITPIFAVSGANIGQTKYCQINRLERFVAASVIVPFVNDTLVFVATSWKLMRHSHAETSIKNGIRVMILGRYLPAFSKAMLQDGQAYYLSLITVNLSSITLYFMPSVPLVYRSMCFIPNVVLMNVMACLIYRKIRFGDYKECPTCAASLSLHQDRSVFAPGAAIAAVRFAASPAAGMPGVQSGFQGIGSNAASHQK
ncbi:hypothetical protein CPC08DRAFT_714025 [Agrocybe pediades]|nr:hypothetical protein CPC08DRAFT_714025 [Agrocybe pediades]